MKEILARAQLSDRICQSTEAISHEAFFFNSLAAIHHLAKEV